MPSGSAAPRDEMNREDDVKDSDLLEADDLHDELEVEPADLDPLTQALQLPELSRGLATATSFLTWGWQKTVENTSQAVDALKENEAVKSLSTSTTGALESIKASESFRTASQSLERAKGSIETTFTETIAPSLHSAVDSVGITFNTTIAPRLEEAAHKVRTVIVGESSSDKP